MIPLRMLAFDGAPEELFEAGGERLKTHFHELSFDQAAENPFVLFFLSGGSERSAIEAAAGCDFVLLLAFEQNNSFAAATEVKARLTHEGTACLLSDINDMADRNQAVAFMKIFMALNTLQGKRLGLIGNPSDWLVASGIEAEVLHARLGIQLEKIAWDNVPVFGNQPTDNAFLEKFSSSRNPDITSSARVYHSLQQVVSKYKLDAFTIECFPLVQQNGVTACLSLSDFNDRGIPAGCEGDLTSIAGMMFLQAVTGIIPWMANLIKVGSDFIRLAHCTAPTGLLESFTVDTHFETGKGNAVSGIFVKGEVTIFRFDSSLGQAFLSSGKIVKGSSSPAGACRTQIEVKLPADKATTLKTNPLGNHHLVLPGVHIDTITRACALKKVGLI